MTHTIDFDDSEYTWPPGEVPGVDGSMLVHADDCWRSPQHHACAVAEIERLRQQVARLETQVMVRDSVIKQYERTWKRDVKIVLTRP